MNFGLGFNVTHPPSACHRDHTFTRSPFIVYGDTTTIFTQVRANNLLGMKSR